MVIIVIYNAFTKESLDKYMYPKTPIIITNKKSNKTLYKFDGKLFIKLKGQIPNFS